MVKDFETVAFTQKINMLSEPVETSFGFHILETTEKSGEKIKVRHILISPAITEEDETNTYNYAMMLRDSSKDLASFKKLVTKYSDDEPTKKIGGDLGWITPTNSPVPAIADVLGLLEKDECSRPVKSDLGYHLLWVEAVKPGGRPSLETHWIEIEEIALNHKRMEYFQFKIIKKNNILLINLNLQNFSFSYMICFTDYSIIFHHIDYSCSSIITNL